MIDNNTILEKARELADLIANSSEVDFFKRAEAQIKKSDKVQSLISQIRIKQKEATNHDHYGRREELEKTESELDRLNDELDEIPIVREFKQSQVEVNDLLQMVTHVITNTVTDKIILSTGGDPLTGETGGEKAGPHTGCSR